MQAFAHNAADWTFQIKVTLNNCLQLNRVFLLSALKCAAAVSLLLKVEETHMQAWQSDGPVSYVCWSINVGRGVVKRLQSHTHTHTLW